MEQIEIEKITPYNKNAKKHSLKQIKQVADSIEKYGFIQPIVISKNNEIVIGHCRYEASKLLGLKEVPIIRVENLNDKEIKALRLADNKLNESEWDMDLVIEELKELDDDMFDITGFDRDLIKDIDFDNIQGNENRDVIQKEITIICPHCKETFNFKL